MATFALIPAAGSGTRLAAASPKQYLALAGKPMLWHAIRALCVPQVAAVFVVLGANDEHFARHDWQAFGEKLHALYCGGETRRESVFNGLVAIGGTVNADDWMLVHDAARPCLPAADLRRLLDEGAGDAIGAILALPVAETVKTAGKDEAGVQRIAATQ
ncbi:MAG: 2-C-methyl-D-erythritol 4-phosphate cytidylyltransferase, partial [Deltaproteobacteria bacterium]